MARRRSASTFGWLSGFWTRLSLTLLILLSLAFLLDDRRSNDVTSYAGIRAISNDLAVPAMWLVIKPMEGASSASNWLSSFWHAGKRVRELEAENETLRQWEALSHALYGKLQRYEALLNMQEEPELRVISTRIIAEARGPFVRSALLRAGRREGVQPGQAVVDPDGLVGRIVNAGNYSARVLLLNDLNSRIPVMFEGTTARAILAGDNQRDPKLIYPGKELVPETGLRVSTSGDDGVLPAGIAIGEILPPDSSGDVRVQMYVNLSRIDFVQILRRAPIIPPEQETETTPTKVQSGTGGAP